MGHEVFQPSHMSFMASTYLIVPGYLNTAQTQLLAGRDFTWHDDDRSPRVAIVNRTFARRLFGNTSAIGQRFALWASARYEVVGVVEDGKYASMGEDEQSAMFLPLAQGVGEVKASTAVVLVRSALPRGQIAAILYRTLNSVERGAPFVVSSWEDAVDRSMVQARMATAMVAVMGLLAAMLAVTGIFGMLSSRATATLVLSMVVTPSGVCTASTGGPSHPFFAIPSRNPSARPFPPAVF